jgi:hypothetical protein
MLIHNFSLHDEVLPCIVVRVGVIKIQISLNFIKRFEKREFLIFLSLSGQILSWPTIFLFFFSFLLGTARPSPPPPRVAQEQPEPSRHLPYVK